jgi:hypothetical protein
LRPVRIGEETSAAPLVDGGTFDVETVSDPRDTDDVGVTVTARTRQVPGFHDVTINRTTSFALRVSSTTVGS